MEQKPKLFLLIDPPNELRFCGPFTRPVVTVMKLTNPNDESMLFKIKTTAPKRYCVRPNFGTVEPHSVTKVEICLQPFVYDANEKNKHKFMVQCLIAPEHCEDFNQLWKETDPLLLMEAKLKCVFEMPPVSSGGDSSGSAAAEMVKDVLPKAANEEKILNLQTSDQTEALMAELRQLREDYSTLRKDNINLKEQIVRLRCSPTKPKMMADEPYTPMMAEKQIPIFYIAISIAAAIFGLLLGKYLL